MSPFKLKLDIPPMASGNITNVQIKKKLTPDS